MSERRFRIGAGLTTLLFLAASSVLGVKVATGALEPRYQVEAVFDTAGQGLQRDSDVKVHGVNIGRVQKVTLHKGRALVRMDIDENERIPVAAAATIRPKTLFGEKFVDIDPGPAETSGPFLADEDTIEQTIGGFELEKVLNRLYPILQAVQPEELAVILDTLAEGGRGQGEAVNRQIRNFAQLAELQARHDADVRRFLDDFAALSDELADRAEDLVGLAEEANQALPPLNQRADSLAAVLDQAARLSTDLTDVLNANQPFQEKAVTVGGKTIQTLFDKRQQLPPLVTGLRQFFQALAEVVHVPSADGTLLAGIKFVTGEDCPEGRDHCPAPPSNPLPFGPSASGSAAGGGVGTGGGDPDAPTSLLPPLPPLPAPTSGVQAVLELVGGLLPR